MTSQSFSMTSADYRRTWPAVSRSLSNFNFKSEFSFIIALNSTCTSVSLSSKANLSCKNKKFFIISYKCDFPQTFFY